MKNKSKRHEGVSVQQAALTLAFLLAGGASFAQTGDESAWFGLTQPPGLNPDEVPVVIGERNPALARVPGGEESNVHLRGATIYEDVVEIVGFSHASRAEREVGDGQFWGRIAGLPSAAETVEWAADELRAAGIENVETQRLLQTEGEQLWLPLRWEMTLLADPSFGPGSADVVLESAMPLPAAELPGGSITAPVVFAGTAGTLTLSQAEVEGKIVLQRVTPRAHSFFETSAARPGAQRLLELGAAAVVHLMDTPGNVQSFDYFGCNGPCFMLGGRDSHFLHNVIDNVAAAGASDKLQMRLELESESRSGLESLNAVAVISGQSEEVILINSHADAWFDGAGDNADGLAVTLALARHFAELDEPPERTLVFLVSVGHHTAGLFGPTHFAAMNPDIIAKTVLALNVEHVAQRNISLSRTFFADGYREWIADASEAPLAAGVTNSSPFLNGLIAEGVERYGVNFFSGEITAASGESQFMVDLGFPIVTTMQAPPLYHTTGEVVEMISTPGLERIARFLAFFLAEVSAAPHASIAGE